MGRPSGLGINLERLKRHILDVSSKYKILTVRQLFYILVSRYGYPNSLNFYKNYLDRYLTRLRLEIPELDIKFTDPSREFIAPPRAWRKTEVWLEKHSLYFFLLELLNRYRLPVQIERGFASLSMFRDALKRARERGVERILYLGDHDPSGEEILKITKREVEVEVTRVALTYEQARELPSRKVNRRDTRARKYIAKYGDRCWEVEVLEPKQLLSIVEEALRREVPATFIFESQLRDEALRITHELLGPLLAKIEMSALKLLARKMSAEQVKKGLLEEFKFLAAGG